MMNSPSNSLGDGFVVAPDLKGGPIPPSEVLENIRANARFDLPLYHKEKGDKGTVIFVGGGPSLLKHLDELKGRSEPILTSNCTHDFLLSHGIKPHSVLIIDPKESVSEYIQNYQKDVTYYFSAISHPKLFEKALAAGVTPIKVLVAFGLEDESDIRTQTALYDAKGHDFLVGGTMTPLRAMNFAVMRGYSKIEFYGFDSCYGSEEPEMTTEDDPAFKSAVTSGAVVFKDADTGKVGVVKDETGFFYAYPKKRAETISVAKTADGRTFLTSPGFAHQAKQFIKWVDRLEGKLEVAIHGDSLNSHMLELHRAYLERKRAKIGDRRWTEEYAELQRKLHEKGGYGVWGDHDLEILGRTVLAFYHNLHRDISILDYGAGSGLLGQTIEKLFRAVKVTNYDPFHPRWRNTAESPGIHDIVNCSDVMEHVELECVENTIKYIAEHVRYAAVFTIALEESIKTLDDGRNAHITLKPAHWWLKKLKEHFVIGEAVQGPGVLAVICQKADAMELIAEEQKNSIREAA